MARRFRFQLDTLLRVRELRQQEAQRKLAAHQARMQQLDHMRSETRNEIVACQDRLRETQSGRVDPRDLTTRRAWILHLRRCLAAAEQQRTQMEQELQDLQQDVRVARMQARMLEKLKERRQDEYQRHNQKLEQRQTDEVAQQLHLRKNSPIGA